MAADFGAPRTPGGVAAELANPHSNFATLLKAARSVGGAGHHSAGDAHFLQGDLSDWRDQSAYFMAGFLIWG